MKQPFSLLNYVVATDFHNTVVLQFSNSSYFGQVPYDQEQKLVINVSVVENSETSSPIAILLQITYVIMKKCF